VNVLLDPTEIGRPTQVKIFKEALQHNLAVVRSYAPSSNVLAMVKANAYGHGLVEIAKTLEASGVEALGVASINEALELRKAGINTEIVLMEGCFCREELALVQAFSLTIVVHQERQIEFLEQSATHLKIPVWLKINIGMNRLGIPASSSELAYERLKKLNWVFFKGCFGHFSDADAIEDPRTLRQMAVFMEASKALPGELCLANSGAILKWPISHLDQVRPGLMLYGVSPFAGRVGKDEGLKPVMHFSSKIIAEQILTPGESLGYSSLWTAPGPKASKIGIVAVGYGDGYPKHAPTGTPVWVAGKIVPLVGRVSMDMLAVDLSEHPAALIGSKVLLWGEELPVELVASHAGTTAYDLLCGLFPRRAPVVYTGA
jgi:alanine racemase